MIAVGSERLQRRVKKSFRLDERAGRRRHAALYRKAHALRFVLDAGSFDMLDPQHKSVGMLAFLTQFDKSGDHHARGRKAQHRVIDERRFYRRNGKAGRDRKQAERQHESDKVTAHSHGARRAHDR